MIGIGWRLALFTGRALLLRRWLHGAGERVPLLFIGSAAILILCALLVLRLVLGLIAPGCRLRGLLFAAG